MDLAGVSIGGLETCIEVPGLKLLLDVGRCSPSAVDHPLVLLSHGHLDHVGGIAQHAVRRALLGRSDGIYVVPRRIAAGVSALFDAVGQVGGEVIPRRVVPLEAPETFPLGKNRWVRPFPTFHPVPSQGYTVWERRLRLREEYRGLPGERLGRLRRAGTVLDEPYDVPLLCFTGDTSVDVLEQHPELRRAECLVIECTFLDDRVSATDAHAMGHIHLDDLVERRELLPAGEIVLVHVSARYSDEEARGLLERGLPDELRPRVRLLGRE